MVQGQARQGLPGLMAGLAVAAVLGSGDLFPSSSALPSYPSDEE